MFQSIANPMSIWCKSDVNPTSTKWKNTVNPAPIWCQLIQIDHLSDINQVTIHQQSDANPITINYQSIDVNPLQIVLGQSNSPRPILDQFENRMPIQKRHRKIWQSITNPPILDQSAYDSQLQWSNVNFPIWCQYSINLPTPHQHTDPGPVCQSTNSPILCHCQSTNPMQQGPIPNC